MKEGTWFTCLLAAVTFVSASSLAQSTPRVPGLAFTDREGLEETLARIVFAHQIETIRHVAQDNRKFDAAELTAALDREQLRLELSNATSGSVREIADRPVSDYISDLGGRTLGIFRAGSSWSITSPDNTTVRTGEDTGATASWASGTSHMDRLGSITFGTAAKQGGVAEISSCTRYVAATVTAGYRRQSGTWQALYLLGCSDAKPHAIDPVMDQAVASFWDVNVYPGELFAMPPYSRNAALRQWLENNSDTGCAAGHACYANGKMVLSRAEVLAMKPLTETGSIQPGTSNDLSCDQYSWAQLLQGEDAAYDDHATGNHNVSLSFSEQGYHDAAPGRDMAGTWKIEPDTHTKPRESRAHE